MPLTFSNVHWDVIACLSWQRRCWFLAVCVPVFHPAVRYSVTYFPKPPCDLSQSRLCFFLKSFLKVSRVFTLSSLPRPLDRPSLSCVICRSGVGGASEDMSYNHAGDCRMMDSLKTPVIYLAVSLLRRLEIMWVHYREAEGRYFESVTEYWLPLSDSPHPSAT